jgi:uncharacterized protein YecT (DUF1311 family)
MTIFPAPGRRAVRRNFAMTDRGSPPPASVSTRRVLKRTTFLVPVIVAVAACGPTVTPGVAGSAPATGGTSGPAGPAPATGGTSGPAGPAPATGGTSGAPAIGVTPGAAGSAPAAGGTVTFVPIVEDFDPGHPARTAPDPGNCLTMESTADIGTCLSIKTENVDAQVNTAQLARFNRSTTAEQGAVNADDAAWLASRGRVCKVAYHSGGSIDEINVGRCVLDESTARRDGVTGIAAPAAELAQTDVTGDLSALNYYTTPGGARISEIDTQGDQTGGGVVSWVIIAGYLSFTVNPAQFFYKDGSFTDAGIIQPSGPNQPSPSYHYVKAGTTYEFSIDYSTISQDPDGSSGAGGYVYAPGGDVLATWGGR